MEKWKAMKPEIKIIEVKEQPTLTIRESTTLSAIPEKIGGIFAEILAFMEKRGISPVGAPFAYWHNMGPDCINKGIFDMECGFPVSVPVEGVGQIKKSKLPGGKVITAMHIGSYDTLAQTYEEVLSWIKENGYQVEDDMWETYLTNPCEEPDQSKWMTEIFFPIKSS
jgi:effector-binding domain-containing protein